MLTRLFSILIIFFVHSLYAQESLKFPNSVKPEHYNVRILILLDASKFEGCVDILVNCCMETNSITLHAAEMDITEGELLVQDVETAEKLKILNIETSTEEDFLTIQLQDNLESNKTYKIHISFQGDLQTEIPRGLYMNTYSDEQGQIHYIANTMFEPAFARYAFPCFDLPHMKATFKFTVGRCGNLFSLNNMPLDKSEPIEGKDGYFWDHFQKTNRMSTYLIAFAVLDDGMRNFSSGRVTFWVPPLSPLDTDTAVEESTRILQFLENYFDMEDQVPKQDFLLVDNYPGFAGASESWGLITAENSAFREQDYYPENTIMLIAHELVHQWIGNIITMKCFGEVWLKEGITSYVDTIAKDFVFDGQTIDIDTANKFIHIMYNFQSHVLSNGNCPENLEDILEHYEPTAYLKGCLFTRMFEMALGIEDFGKTLNSLFTKYKFKNFDEIDLAVTLSEMIPHGNFPSSLHLDVVLKSWTEQDGFPLVEVTRNYEDGTAVFEQRKFFSDNPEDEGAYCWWIPISYITKSGHQVNEALAASWMNCPRQPLTITDLNSTDWILTNLQSTGLFIVKYDDENWKLLSETLRDKNTFEIIPYWNRFRLILDSLFLTDLGLKTHESLLTSLLYLEHETNYIVWIAALKYLDKIDWLEEDVVHLKHEYMLRLVQPHFSKQLFDLTNSSLSEMKFKREIIRQACLSGDEICIKESLRLFDEFKNTYPEESSLEKSLQGIVFCIGAKFGPEENTQFLIKINTQSVDEVQFSQISNALHCSEPHSQKQDRLKPTTSNRLVDRLLKKRKIMPEGADEATFIEVLKDIVEPLLEKPYSALNVHSILILADEIHQPQILSYMEMMFQKHERLFLPYKKITEEITKKIKRNIEWKKSYSREIKSALTKILKKKDEIMSIFLSTSRAPPEPPDLKRSVSSKSYQSPSSIEFPLEICMCILVGFYAF